MAKITPTANEIKAELRSVSREYSKLVGFNGTAKKFSFRSDAEARKELQDLQNWVADLLTSINRLPDGNEKYESKVQADALYGAISKEIEKLD